MFVQLLWPQWERPLVPVLFDWFPFSGLLVDICAHVEGALR